MLLRAAKGVDGDLLLEELDAWLLLRVLGDQFHRFNPQFVDFFDVAILPRTLLRMAHNTGPVSMMSAKYGGLGHRQTLPAATPSWPAAPDCGV